MDSRRQLSLLSRSRWMTRVLHTCQVRLFRLQKVARTVHRSAQGGLAHARSSHVLNPLQYAQGNQG